VLGFQDEALFEFHSQSSESRKSWNIWKL